MGRGITATNFPNQTIYTFAATSRILGVHVTTLHKRARDGRLKTVNTPVGRRIHRDEIRRQCGESDEKETGAQFEPAGADETRLRRILNLRPAVGPARGLPALIKMRE